MIRRAAAVACGAGLAAVAVLPASAHVVQQVGTYSLAIGWAAEPAWSGFDNGVQVLVNDAAGKGVPDLAAGALKVQVSIGGKSSATLDMRPAFDPDGSFGTPGDYRADLIPTVPGAYTFHVTGNVHGTKVDQTVTAGDKTFSVVKEPSEVQFPTKLSSGNAVATQLDRTSARLATAQKAADDASSAANRAMVIGIVALVAGVVLGGTGVALAMRRRRTA
jgi:hypothetical protein